MELSELEYELYWAKIAVERLKDCSAARCRECPFYDSEDWNSCEGLLISDAVKDLDEFFKALKG